MLNGIGFLLFMLTLIARGPAGNADLLDMVPTESYWKSKNITPSVDQLQKDAGPDVANPDTKQLLKDLASDDFKIRDAAKRQIQSMGEQADAVLKPMFDSKDPEAVAIATDIQKNMASKKKERSVRRLMAIRTLGEVPQKSNLPFLKTLTDSKEPFVADYANRAIAQIEGKKLPPVNHQKKLAADLAFIPKDTGILGQASGLIGPSLSLDKIAEMTAEQSNRRQGNFGRDMQLDKAKALSYIGPAPIQLAEAVGNLRCDAATMAIADNIGNRSGWVLFSFHGQYDAKAFLEAVKAMSTEPRFPGDGNRPAPKLTREGKVDVLEAENLFLLAPSNEQLIMIVAAPRTGKPAQVDSVLAVLNGGKGEFDQNEDLNKLMKTIDLTAPVWAVGKIPAEVKREKMFSAIESFAATARQPKENLEISGTVTATDATQLNDSITEATSMFQMGIREVSKEIEKNKALQPVIDLLESIKITPKDNTATVAGEIKPTILDAMLSEGPFFWMIYREQQKAKPAPGAELIDPAPQVERMETVPVPN
jgi:hypothetical protein